MNDAWVTLARLTRPRGTRGEVLAEPLSDQPLERFQRLGRAFLLDPETGERAEHRVESVWEHQGRLVFKFAGIDRIEDAGKVAGRQVQVPREERAPLPQGEFYLSDLVGCTVVERDGTELGTVTDWENYGGPDLLRVEGPGGELLIPFVRSICPEIDPAGRRIVVDLPEGLKDLG
ncbi:MAG: 16S rRNA processing protein RimM [Acidobacteria bacterium]|nr:16S rRNA processing protein RimM [Acidobacteriota bacterium]